MIVKVEVVAGKMRLSFLRLGSHFWKVEKGVKLVPKHWPSSSGTHLVALVGEEELVLLVAEAEATEVGLLEG